MILSGTTQTNGNAFFPEIQDEPSAIPAFIGYTEKAIDGTTSLLNVPRKISSPEEYITFYGGAHIPVYAIEKADPDKTDIDTLSKNDILFKAPEGEFLLKADQLYTLYFHLQQYFAQGGTTCYIVSAGSYQDKPDVKAFCAALDALAQADEPDLLVVPEAVNLTVDECLQVHQAMLEHCGAKTKNRFALFDLYQDKPDDPMASAADFKARFKSDYLSFGTVYFPRLNTIMRPQFTISLYNLGLNALFSILQTGTEDQVRLLASTISEELDDDDKSSRQEEDIRQSLLRQWHSYPLIVDRISAQMGQLPPSAAIAALYAVNDKTKCIRHDPLHLSLKNVASLTHTITDVEQQSLEAPDNSIAMNTIRAVDTQNFDLSSAYTLDKKTPVYTSISIMRTQIYLERIIGNYLQSISAAPVTPETAALIKERIEAYLFKCLQKGMLAGSASGESFHVEIRPNEIKTSDNKQLYDLLISVNVALTGPAEFIALNFIFSHNQGLSDA